MPQPKDAPTCEPPRVLVCGIPPGGGTVLCQCLQDAPHPPPTPVVTAPLCTVSIVYPVNNPGGVYLAAKDSYCDGAGIEIAFAVLLAKLMTGPPLP